jgi:radical SAM protein with 4Fe4S-binding SPASM domain
MQTRINVTQLCLDDSERQRQWEEDRRFPLLYFKNRYQWFHYPKWRYVAPFPLHVDFEVSSRCNLGCPMCFRRYFENDHEFVDMDFDLFRKGVDECAANGLYSIRLSWRGEPTLNPNLTDMIRYAKEKGIKEISFLSNGSALNRDFCMDLVDSGLDYVTISVDGLPDEYNKLRAPLDFDETFAKIKELFELKVRYGSGFPKIKIQGIYDYFQNDIDAYYNTFKPVSDNISFNMKHDYQLRDVQQEDSLFCPYLWQRITITASGLVPLCISDWDSEIVIGDLNQTSIQRIWNGSEIEKIRKLHTNNKRLQIGPCRKCIRSIPANLDIKI